MFCTIKLNPHSPSDARYPSDRHLRRFNGGHFTIAPKLGLLLVQRYKLGIHSNQLPRLGHLAFSERCECYAAGATASSDACVLCKHILVTQLSQGLIEFDIINK